MAISSECECGKRLKVDPKYAGRSLQCPACGVKVAVPGSRSGHELASPLPDDEDGLARLRKQAPAPTMTPQEVVRTFTHPERTQREAEPTSYRWAEALSSLIAALGVLQFVFALLGLGVPLIASASDHDSSVEVGTSIGMLAVSPGMAASAVLTSAVVGVIVDGARNTRLLLAELRAK